MQHTPIAEVPRDFNPDKIKAVINPLDVDFEFEFAGKKHTIGAGKMVQYTEPMAYHAAKHIAIKILMSSNHKFLLDNFPGLDAAGREKWKAEAKHFFSKKDIKELQNKMVFNYIPGETLPKTPDITTKFDKINKETFVEAPKVEIVNAVEEIEAGNEEPEEVEEVEETPEEEPEKPTENVSRETKSKKGHKVK